MFIRNGGLQRVSFKCFQRGEKSVTQLSKNPKSASEVEREGKGKGKGGGKERENMYLEYLEKLEQYFKHFSFF